MPDKRLIAIGFVWLLLSVSTPRAAEVEAPFPADISVREVTMALVAARRSVPADFSGRALRYLDLSALDFGGASLKHADLYGADISQARLVGSDLTRIRLDRANIAKADFSGADLSGATLLRPNAFLTPAFDIRDAPRFVRARLVGVRVKARLDGADFSWADMTRIDMSPLEKRPGERDAATNSRNSLVAANFTGARLVEADLTLSIFTHARFNGADLSRAKLVGTDLSHADFSGALVAGADFSGADLDSARLAGAIGLDSAIGLGVALNLDKAVR